MIHHTDVLSYELRQEPHIIEMNKDYVKKIRDLIASKTKDKNAVEELYAEVYHMDDPLQLMLEDLKAEYKNLQKYFLSL